MSQSLMPATQTTAARARKIRQCGRGEQPSSELHCSYTL